MSVTEKHAPEVGYRMFWLIHFTTIFLISIFTGSSWQSSVFLVVNAALGAGLLNFPDAYHKAGGVLVAVVIQAVSTLHWRLTFIDTIPEYSQAHHVWEPIHMLFNFTYFGNSVMLMVISGTEVSAWISEDPLYIN